jgi:hypothetical protein
MRTRTEKACQDAMANKKLKEQFLGWATYCSLTGSELET